MSPAPSTADEPQREKLLPQASIRFFLLTIGGSGIIMFIFRLAIVGEATWAIVIALMLSLVFAMFATYFVLFLVASALATSAKPLRSSLSRDSESQNSNPKVHS